MLTGEQGDREVATRDIGAAEPTGGKPRPTIYDDRSTGGREFPDSRRCRKRERTAQEGGGEAESGKNDILFKYWAELLLGSMGSDHLRARRDHRGACEEKRNLR